MLLKTRHAKRLPLRLRSCRLHVTWPTNARSATLTTVNREAQALETVGDSADRPMEVPGVSDNVQVSERVLFASWHCGVFGTTAPAILTGCYRLCLISTPPGLMPDNCNRLLPLPRPLAARSPQLTRHCAFTSQRWNRECSQRFLRPSATTPLRLRKGPFRHGCHAQMDLLFR